MSDFQTTPSSQSRPDNQDLDAAGGQPSPNAISATAPIRRSRSGNPPPPPTKRETITTGPSSVADPFTPDASPPTTPNDPSRPGTDLPDPTSHFTYETQRPVAGGAGTQNTPSSQGCTDTQESCAAGGQDTSTDPGLKPPGTQDERAGAVDALLLIVADQLDDIEHTRTAAHNRYRSLTQTWEVDGVTYGKGLNPDLPECVAVADLIAGLDQLEHQLVLQLKRVMRKHPLGPWVKQAKGVGEKQAARLLAVIGDPGSRRGPGQLWAYCGLQVWHQTIRQTNPIQASSGASSSVGGDPSHVNSDTQPQHAGVAPHRRKGEKVTWNSEARKRIWVIAESAIKAGIRKSADAPKTFDPDHRTAISGYGQVYLDGRRKYASAKHRVECVRCGPAGKPAPVGSDLSDGHKHARAHRLVMKRILKDMWRAAREHEGVTEHAA